MSAGAGGIGNMRRAKQSLRSWREQHETRGKACGLIRTLCHRGSSGIGANRLTRCRRSGDCEMLVHRSSVNQRLPVWKPITYFLNTQGG